MGRFFRHSPFSNPVHRTGVSLLTTKTVLSLGSSHFAAQAAFRSAFIFHLKTSARPRISIVVVRRRGLPRIICSNLLRVDPLARDQRIYFFRGMVLLWV